MIAFLALKTNLYEKVKMIYSAERLQEKDKKDFAALFKTVDLDSKIEYTTNIDFKPDKKELLIMDEGDEFIFKDPTAAFDFINGSQCILLTATLNGGDHL
jgi:hypothetical protein